MNRPWRIDRPNVVPLPPWLFAPLLPRSYSVVVIDPPWDFTTYSQLRQHKAASAHYDVMTTEEIMALPVRRLCQDDCLVLVWATAPMLTHALACMSAWRIVYKSNMVWRKVTASGKVRMGLGFWARTMHEQILIGTVGKPSKIKTMPSVFDGIAREHSRKPDEFYRIVETHAAGHRRADIFARETRTGWDAFGDEAGKYDV
jgi:N6-adenosine-specific RNA methylase IME4